MIRPPRLRSLQARLAILFALLVAGTLLATGGLAFHLTRSHLDRALDESLLSSVRSFQAGPARGPSNGLALRAERWLAQQATAPGSVLAVRVAQNRVLATSSDLDLGQIPQADSLLTSDRSVMDVVDTPDGEVRVVALPLEGSDGYVGTFIAAARRSSVDDTLAALARGIGIAGAAVLAIAALLGVLLVRAALRPLERIAASAVAVEKTGDLTRRVSGDLADDEVGRLGRSFDAMLERLQNSFARQQTFLSDAAHEIRTPLTVSRGQLEWLQGSVDDPEEKRALSIAIEEIDRVDRSVDDLLLLARLDEGATLVPQPVDVDLIMSEAALRPSMLFARKVNVTGGEGVRVQADPQRLMQVLENLIINALKHAGSEAQVTLTARTEGSRALIEVADDGRGIPADELARVFERHYRVRSEGGSGAPGSGLGLAIAKSLTEAMGGGLSAASEVGKGSVFTVALLLVAEDEPFRFSPGDPLTS